MRSRRERDHGGRPWRHGGGKRRGRQTKPVESELKTQGALVDHHDHDCVIARGSDVLEWLATVEARCGGALLVGEEERGVRAALTMSGSASRLWACATTRRSRE
jgi:hypothetical protein